MNITLALHTRLVAWFPALQKSLRLTLLCTDHRKRSVLLPNSAHTMFLRKIVRAQSESVILIFSQDPSLRRILVRICARINRETKEGNGVGHDER